MENNFDSPQRQSPIGILVLFLNTSRKYIVALWPVLILSILKFNELNLLFVFFGIIVFTLIVGVVSYLSYLNFTFYIDSENNEFIINEGIINKTKTTIQLNKIQQVNINQSLIQRLIGVYALDVDSAGSVKKEANIKAISHQLAVSLKSKLINLKTGNVDEKKDIDTSENEVLTEESFLEISFLSLLKIGITSNYLKSFGLIITFFLRYMKI
jgi:putative membrane protein